MCSLVVNEAERLSVLAVGSSVPLATCGDRGGLCWQVGWLKMSLLYYSRTAPADKVPTLLRRLANDVSRPLVSVLSVVFDVSSSDGSVTATVFFSFDDGEDELRHQALAGDPVGANNLGVLLKDEGRREEAVAAYRVAIDLGSDTALVNLADLLVHDGQVEEARQLLIRAMDLGEPSSAERLAELEEGD